MGGVKKTIQVETLAFGPELCELEAEWDALLMKSSRPTIFSSFDFIYTSCRDAEVDKQVFMLLFRDVSSSELLAIYPMRIEKANVCGIQLLELTHAVTPQDTDVDKPYPIISKEHEAACWDRFREYFRREYTAWDVITYEEVFEESHLCRQLKSMFSFPAYWTKSKSGPTSPIVKLDGDWNEFWMDHRKLRKKSRRLERTLGEKLVYEVTCDPKDVERCLNGYSAVELISWKAGAYVATKEQQAFYRELWPRFSAKGRLYFGIMSEEDKVISVEVAYTFKDRVYFVHGTYDPDYAKLSVGTVNSSRLIEFFHGKGYVEGDFLAGYAGYNNPWASRIENTQNVVIRKMNGKNWYLAFRHLFKKVMQKVRRILFAPSDENIKNAPTAV